MPSTPEPFGNKLIGQSRPGVGVATSLKTALAIRAEIAFLKGERRRWRDFAARGVVTGESFIVSRGLSSVGSQSWSKSLLLTNRPRLGEEDRPTN